MTIPSDTLAANSTRELAAIMFSDIVGYTAIKGRDEQMAMRALASIASCCAASCQVSTAG